MVTFHPETVAALQHQARRLHHALHGTNPPDRKEAALIQRRVDDILDRRPRVFAVASDGEIVWDTASAWEKGQVGGPEFDAGGWLPPGMTLALNDDGEPEVFLPHGLFGMIDQPEDRRRDDDGLAGVG